MNAPHPLETKVVEKVWGRRGLPEAFAAHESEVAAEPVGEIWFESPEPLAHILVKYLFTSEKLSVQVHPSDAQAEDGEDGKEECWLVLDAEPGAQLAIGFREEISAQRMRAAALDGSIEQLLDWREVHPGDFFYLPAGTVHAIGAGLSLVEVQQSSDTTFRFFDYGRPRELHLERAIAVADGGSYDAKWRQRAEARTQRLVSGPHFVLDRIVGAPDDAVLAAIEGPVMVLPLKGRITSGDKQLNAGSCIYADRVSAFSFADDALSLVVSSA